MPPFFLLSFGTFALVSARGGGLSQSQGTEPPRTRGEAGAPWQRGLCDISALAVQRGDLGMSTPSSLPLGSQDTECPSPWATQGDPEHLKHLFEHSVCSLPPNDEGGPGTRSMNTETHKGQRGLAPPGRGPVCRVLVPACHPCPQFVGGCPCVGVGTHNR